MRLKEIEISKASDKQLKQFMETELPTTVLKSYYAKTSCEICLTKEEVIYRIEIDSCKVKNMGLNHIIFLCRKCENKLSKFIYLQPLTKGGTQAVINYFIKLSSAIHMGNRESVRP